MRITVFQQDTGQGSCGQEQDIITVAEETGEAGHQRIIMDGNRRWARQKGLDPKLGHKEGAKTLEKIVQTPLK